MDAVHVKKFELYPMINEKLLHIFKSDGALYFRRMILDPCGRLTRRGRHSWLRGQIFAVVQRRGAFMDECFCAPQIHTLKSNPPYDGIRKLGLWEITRS